MICLGAFLLANAAFGAGFKDTSLPRLLPAEPVNQTGLSPLLSGSLIGRQVCGPQGNCVGNRFSIS